MQKAHQAHSTTCAGSVPLNGGLLVRDKCRIALRRFMSAAAKGWARGGRRGLCTRATRQ